VTTVAFSPDGHTLASIDALGEARLWDAADPAHPHPLGQTFGSTPVSLVAFSPGGHILASVSSPARGSGGSTVQLWDVTDPAHPRLLGQPQTSNEFVDSLAFSPSGHTLASASNTANGNSSIVQLWDVADPAHPRLLGQPLIVGDGSVVSVAFSPDGHTLASSSNTTNGLDSTVQLWDVADPAHPRLLGQPQIGNEFLDSLAFSPDGHTLASASSPGPASGSSGSTVQLWDVTDPADPRLLGQSQTGGSGSVITVAFSPDGHTLVGSDYGGTVQLWDVTDPANPRPLGQPPTGGISAVDSVAFSPDGHTLATGSLDGTIRLWNLNVQYAIERICATAGRLKPRQWNQYIPQLRYQPSCID
jgi:WD40 repeat protein